MNSPIILASASPRRKQLLESVDLAFTCVTSQVEEVFDTTLPIPKAIESLALQKAEEVAKRHRDAIVIGADTMVVFEQQVLGKPKDDIEAKAMLQMLSGKTHQVITGVALVYQQQVLVFHETTNVTFYTLEEEMINAYVASKEPLDKAGSYGIQGKASIFVEAIQGDYCNVVGLPLAKVYRYIQKIKKSV